MDWTTVGPAVFSLLGVALGTAGSLLGVYYAQRTAREQARLQHTAAMRTERRDIYVEYLSAVENSWSFLDGLWGRQPLTSVDGQPLAADQVDREAAIRNHEVWYHQQKIALVAPDHVRNAALKLTQGLYKASFDREGAAEGPWGYLDPFQEAFLQAAREDLEVRLPAHTDKSPGPVSGS
jgi:hypothetical protein